jgi:hypothetical protein
MGSAFAHVTTYAKTYGGYDLTLLPQKTLAVEWRVSTAHKQPLTSMFAAPIFSHLPG